MCKFETFFYRHFEFAWNMASAVSSDFKHFSIITNSKLHILSTGTNNGRTHPMMLKYHYRYPNVHSELDAFVKLTYTQKLNGLYLFNYRFNKNGVLGNARPCINCAGWCLAVFDDIFHSDGQRKFSKMT